MARLSAIWLANREFMASAKIKRIYEEARKFGNRKKD